jgi:hypothetical protein
MPLSLTAEIELLQREMFSTNGHFAPSNPGTNFSAVEGRLEHLPGGPKLQGLQAASADLRDPSGASFGRFTIDPAHRKIFIGAWFLIREQSSLNLNVDLISICDIYGNPSPSVSIYNNILNGGIRYNNFQPANVPWKNQWVYLATAVSLKEGTIADVRFYYKLRGQPMVSWGELNNTSIGITTIGQAILGNLSGNSNCKGRMGAASVYSFEEDDFSDITYPEDLIEPNSQLRWYCNPLHGNDENDGSTPETAWKTVTKINQESLHTGFLPANSYAEGDTLIIDTSEAPLDLNGSPLGIMTPGLNIQAAKGAEWIVVKSYRTIPNASWQDTATPNVFSTSDTQNHIVLWENDLFLHHVTGASFAAVASTLSSTPGSFWTDGVTLYVHPFGSTNPKLDGKRYERSYNFNGGSAVTLNAPNLMIQDLHVGKTCLAGATNNDPIGAYCVSFDFPPGHTVLKHAYLYYGSKHIVGIVSGGLDDDVLLEDVQCEQGSPYAAPGGQTLLVSFNHQPLDFQIKHRFHRCRSTANAGLVGSSAGTMTRMYPVFYSHNLETPGEPDQFEFFEFIDCDFGSGGLNGQAVKSVHLRGTRCGFVSMNTDVYAERCHFLGMNQVNEGGSLVERHCIHTVSGELGRNPAAGSIDIRSCTFDARGVTTIQGGVPQASLFTREGALTLVFENNLILMPANLPTANIFSYFRAEDAISMSHNAYQLGVSNYLYQYHNGMNVSNRSLAQWQSIGKDLNSFLVADLQLDNTLRPTIGSPITDAGKDQGSAADYTGRTFRHRNDIGAFESPPTTFASWQAEHFSNEEIADESISSRQASYLNDGVSNAIKYALGVSPSTPVEKPLELSVDPDLTSPEHPGSISLHYQQSRWASDVNLIIRWSSDLLSWSDAIIVDKTTLSQSFDTEWIHAQVLPQEASRGFFKLDIVFNHP